MAAPVQKILDTLQSPVVRSLYVPPVWHSTILLSAHSVFVCFEWITEQRAIISLYSTNWMVFITETECVYCAVRTWSLHVSQVNFCVQSFAVYLTRITSGHCLGMSCNDIGIEKDSKKGRRLVPADEGTRIFRNIGNYLATATASCGTRLDPLLFSQHLPYSTRTMCMWCGVLHSKCVWKIQEHQITIMNIILTS